MDPAELEHAVAERFEAGTAAVADPSTMSVFLELRAALERGEVRAASPDPGSPSGWRVNAWVKQGILLGFRIGMLHDSSAGGFSFVDKHTYPIRHFTAEEGIRVVPGGSSIRAGAYLARG